MFSSNVLKQCLNLKKKDPNLEKVINSTQPCLGVCFFVIYLFVQVEVLATIQLM